MGERCRYNSVTIQLGFVRRIEALSYDLVVSAAKRAGAAVGMELETEGSEPEKGIVILKGASIGGDFHSGASIEVLAATIAARARDVLIEQERRGEMPLVRIDAEVSLRTLFRGDL